MIPRFNLAIIQEKSNGRSSRSTVLSLHRIISLKRGGYFNGRKIRQMEFQIAGPNTSFRKMEDYPDLKEQVAKAADVFISQNFISINPVPRSYVHRELIRSSVQEVEFSTENIPLERDDDWYTSFNKRFYFNNGIVSVPMSFGIGIWYYN